MARKSSMNIDVAGALRGVGDQFRGLDTRDPSSWPIIPRSFLFLVTAALVVLLAWLGLLKGEKEVLEAEQNKEVALRGDYQARLRKAVNLDELKKQKEQVRQYVDLLEKQLPSRAEMDALLSDINQAGLGRSLQFDLFRPGQLVIKEYYAELPISVKVTGAYHDMGAFVSDIAQLSRIVTLNNISVAPSPDKEKAGSLVLETTAKTFRYLDQEEVDAQKKAQAAAAQGGRK